MKILLNHRYEDVISVENLLDAWAEFVRGKRYKSDVLLFQRHFMDHITSLHNELADGSYCHGEYETFNVADPKPRKIHKASVKDRLLHHAIYRLLYPFFDRTFIADSFSCRDDKGTHRAIFRFTQMGRQVSKNNTKSCWVLKCDIRQFFASIDHTILKQQLRSYIPDNHLNTLLNNIIDSFSVSEGRGLPLGNLTSQLFVNVYMNTFDQFVKHHLRQKHYIRYADDFVFFSPRREDLVQLLPRVHHYLVKALKLELHPKKIILQTLASGVDFLGWVHFPDHHVLRPATRRGMMRRVIEHPTNETLQSYLGMLQHRDAYKLRTDVQNTYGLWNTE